MEKCPTTALPRRIRTAPVGGPVFEAADERVTQWATALVEVEGEGAVRLDPPGREPGAHAYLFDVECRPPARGAPSPHVEILLRYLVTATAATTSEAHRLLGALLASALAQPDFEVDAGRLPLALWQALGTVPQPAFVIRVSARIPLEQVRGPRVTQPAAIELRVLSRKE